MTSIKQTGTKARMAVLQAVSKGIAMPSSQDLRCKRRRVTPQATQDLSCVMLNFLCEDHVRQKLIHVFYSQTARN